MLNLLASCRRKHPLEHSLLSGHRPPLSAPAGCWGCKIWQLWAYGLA